MSFLFAHRRGYGVVPAAGRGTFPPSADGESPAEVQRKTLCPERANTPAAVRAPRFSGAEKEPPVRANTLTQFVCPAQPVQKTSLVFKLNCFSDNATAKRHTQAETA